MLGELSTVCVPALLCVVVDREEIGAGTLLFRREREPLPLEDDDDPPNPTAADCQLLPDISSETSETRGRGSGKENDLGSGAVTVTVADEGEAGVVTGTDDENSDVVKGTGYKVLGRVSGNEEPGYDVGSPWATIVVSEGNRPEYKGEGKGWREVVVLLDVPFPFPVLLSFPSVPSPPSASQSFLLPFSLLLN